MDNYKIKKSLATIKFLIEKRAKVILVSLLGRPALPYGGQGGPNGLDKKLSLKPVAIELGKFLQKTVSLLDVTNLAKHKIKLESLLPGAVVMLENIRFLAGEEANSEKLSKELAGLADIFVLDGFAVAHRKSASVCGVVKYLPAYAGLLLEAEIAGLNRALKSPRKPLVVVLGGAKIETKMPVLKNLLKTASYVLLGGGLVNTYLWAKGKKVGVSLINKNFKKDALRFCGKSKVILPVDVIVGAPDGRFAKAVDVNDLNIPPPRRGAASEAAKNINLGIFDIGPKTIKLFARYIKKSQTLVWNGAVGFFEQHPYEYGTYSMARLMAARSRGKAFGIAGGGETIEVLKKLRLLDDVDLASTGGGSMLEYLSGNKLPGMQSLMK